MKGGEGQTSEFADAVEGKIDDFLADGVVAARVVVGGVFLAGDQLFGVEQLAVGARSHFVNDSGFQINEDTSRNVLARTRLREEGVEGIITTADGLVRWHLTCSFTTHSPIAYQMRCMHNKSNVLQRRCMMYGRHM